jgi:hypothetical protein
MKCQPSCMNFSASVCVDKGPAPPVCSWIEADLKAVDRSKTPWLIVGMHRMMYCDSSDYRSNDDSDHTVSSRIRSSLEDLFYTYKASAWHAVAFCCTPVPACLLLLHKLALSLSAHSCSCRSMLFSTVTNTCKPSAVLSVVLLTLRARSISAKTSRLMMSAGWRRMAVQHVKSLYARHGCVCRYQRTCPTYQYSCQPSRKEENTGLLNTLNTNTTSTYYDPSAPIYVMAGHAGARRFLCLVQPPGRLSTHPGLASKR